MFYVCPFAQSRNAEEYLCANACVCPCLSVYMYFIMLVCVCVCLHVVCGVYGVCLSITGLADC